jgi:hypothetical protein
MSTKAPERFAAWLAAHEHKDRKLGFVYRYHPRSDAHSKEVCRLIVEDLIAASPSLARRAQVGDIVYAINCPYTFPVSKKVKTLDFVIAEGSPDTTREAIGTVLHPAAIAGEGKDLKARPTITRVLICCECKAAMTEHSKAQPRIYDELSSSHEIVHQGDPDAIAAGITVVNIAKTFVSPTRQKNKKKLEVTHHKQPQAAERMIKHLRGLPIRGDRSKPGFDAYATIVVDCDNQKMASLWTDPPAPQPGDPDHYDIFLASLARACEERLAE